MSASSGKQDFLEADPYWDQSGVPVNTYKNKSPFTSKVVSVKRIVGPQVLAHAAAETQPAFFFNNIISSPASRRTRIA